MFNKGGELTQLPVFFRFLVPAHIAHIAQSDRVGADFRRILFTPCLHGQYSLFKSWRLIPMSAYEIIRRPPERSDFSDEVYSMIGRALTLASRFEASCKALALLMGIRRRSSDGSFSLSRVEDLESLVSKISERRLFQEIKSVVECLNFPEDAKKLFHAARADRNFVAHELTFGIEHLLESDEELEASQVGLSLESSSAGNSGFSDLPFDANRNARAASNFGIHLRLFGICAALGLCLKPESCR